MAFPSSPKNKKLLALFPFPISSRNWKRANSNDLNSAFILLNF
jgi:hypothetical protein